MENRENISVVTDKARKNFLEIRKLRKEMPHFTRVEKDILEWEIQKLREQWWEGVKPYFMKKLDDPFMSPFTLEKIEIWNRMGKP